MVGWRIRFNAYWERRNIVPEPFSPPPDKRDRIKSRLVLLGFLAVAAFFLLAEHRAHILGVLPYLFLLACPLMHMFMHHGHHHGSANTKRTDTAANSHDSSKEGVQ
jgi:Protein of unknown function (DUF2933)